MKQKLRNNEQGFHLIILLFVILVIGAIGLVGYKVTRHKSTSLKNSVHTASPSTHVFNQDDANSLDPLIKGKLLSNNQCSGSGSKALTHAPMNISDVSTISPMGQMTGGHVTPIDHEYYYGANQNAPVNTYPVYADADGTIVGIEFVNDGTKDAWWVTIAHSCTFISNYNLLTSISPTLKAKLPAGWGPNSNGGIHIPVKSGELIGYVGHQSLDFQVWNTQKTLKGLLYRIAYNNREAWKVNTVAPLDYFTNDIKSQILPRYIRTVEPRDGKIDYDVDGEAVGTWFLTGTNGYAGGDDTRGSAYAGHLSLAYDALDPSALTFSIGDYQGQPMQFAVKGSVDWKKITKNSGLVKVELAARNWITSTGDYWHGQYATGIRLTPGTTQATALLQMTDKQDMKVEVFPGKTPAQVSAFDANSKTYNRGQDAHMVKSNTAT